MKFGQAKESAVDVMDRDRGDIWQWPIVMKRIAKKAKVPLNP